MRGDTLCVVIRKGGFPQGLGKLVQGLNSSQIGYISTVKTNYARKVLEAVVIPVDYIEGYNKASKPSWWVDIMGIFGTEANVVPLKNFELSEDECLNSFADKPTRLGVTDVKELLSLFQEVEENFKVRKLANNFTILMKMF